MKTMRRATVALGAAIAVGVLTVGSVGALPHARGTAAGSPRVNLTIENESKRPVHVQIVPFSVNCIPDFAQPLNVLSHERRNLTIELSESPQCRLESKRAQWRVSDLKAGPDSPDFAQFSYERRAYGDEERLDCTSRKGLGCVTSGPRTVRILDR